MKKVNDIHGTKKYFQRFLYAILIVTLLSLAYLLNKPTVQVKIDPSPSPSQDTSNKIYGNQDFVVDYKLIDGVYVYDNPENLTIDQWYDSHQYYPTDYGYGLEEQSSPKNKVQIDDLTFQYGVVFSYPSNYYATLLAFQGKMYLKNYHQIPTNKDLRKFALQVVNF